MNTEKEFYQISDDDPLERLEKAMRDINEASDYLWRIYNELSDEHKQKVYDAINSLGWAYSEVGTAGSMLKRILRNGSMKPEECTIDFKPIETEF